MKKIVLMIVPALICGMVLTSCSTDNLKNVHEIEGTYVGSYTTTNVTRGLSWKFVATIEFKEGKYIYRGLSEGLLSDIYAVSGNYSISNNKITFDITSYDGPAVDFVVVEGFAVFLLDGEYKYNYGGKKLIFSKAFEQIQGNEKYRCEFEFDKQ